MVHQNMFNGSQGLKRHLLTQIYDLKNENMPLRKQITNVTIRFTYENSNNALSHKL